MYPSVLYQKLSNMFTHLKLLFFKVAKEHGLVCAWDLEQFGYQELEVSSKLELFKVVKNIFWIFLKY